MSPELTSEFLDGLKRQLGQEDADVLLNPPRSDDGATARIQRPGHPHSKAMARLLAYLMPGHRETLCVGRPCDMATSVAVATTQRGNVAIGRKVPQDKHYVGKYCLAPAGWFDDTRDPHLIATIIREGLEELKFELDPTRILDLGRFITVNEADTREASFPSHKTGYLYELNSSEWAAMLRIDPQAKDTEVAYFRLVDEEEFEALVRSEQIVFPDQIWFVRRYFKLKRNGRLSDLEPIAHEGSTSDRLVLEKQL